MTHQERKEMSKLQAKTKKAGRRIEAVLQPKMTGYKYMLISSDVSPATAGEDVNLGSTGNMSAEEAIVVLNIARRRVSELIDARNIYQGKGLLADDKKA
jgi:hypothetical protein